MLAAFWAVLVTVLGLLAVGWWFGMYRRRLVETEAGVQSLANMKWRECIGLVLEALQKEGYREDRSDRHVSDGGAEYLLTRGSEKVLLSYKHGTAYRIGEANVRDFANGVQMQGASSGMLITLGTAESMARDLAKRYGVQLIDGPALWPKIQGYAPVSISAHVKSVALAQTQKGLWMGATACVALGIVTFIAGDFMGTDDSSAQPQLAVVPIAARSAPVTEDPTLKQINETARAMAQVANLTDQQLAERRVKAAREVSAIVQIGSAGWSTQSTLQLNLKQTDGVDAELIDEVCRILTQYEELRFTRVQLDPPENSNTPVRWRQCQ
jgi:restriction endonuclease Mrr